MILIETLEHLKLNFRTEIITERQIYSKFVYEKSFSTVNINRSTKEYVLILQKKSNNLFLKQIWPKNYSEAFSTLNMWKY